MKSYKSYKKLRTSYDKVTKSYEKLQKVTNELRGPFQEPHLPKSWKNGLPIRAPRQPKTTNQDIPSERFRTSQKPFHRKNAPLARGMASHHKKQGCPHLDPMGPPSAPTSMTRGNLIWTLQVATFGPTTKNRGAVICSLCCDIGPGRPPIRSLLQV